MQTNNSINFCPYCNGQIPSGYAYFCPHCNKILNKEYNEKKITLKNITNETETFKSNNIKEKYNKYIKLNLFLEFLGYSFIEELIKNKSNIKDKSIENIIKYINLEDVLNLLNKYENPIILNEISKKILTETFAFIPLMNIINLAKKYNIENLTNRNTLINTFVNKYSLVELINILKENNIKIPYDILNPKEMISLKTFTILEQIYRLDNITLNNYLKLLNKNTNKDHLKILINNLNNEYLLSFSSLNENDLKNNFCKEKELENFIYKQSLYNYCMICGSTLTNKINKHLIKTFNKYEARCENCLQQIYILKFYKKIKDKFNTEMFIKEEIFNLTQNNEEFEYNWNLLNKYSLITPYSEELYKINENNNINPKIKSLLKTTSTQKQKTKMEEYWNLNTVEKKEEDKIPCKICGKLITKDPNETICKDCFNKTEIAKDLYKLINFISPNMSFFKNDLIKKGFNEIDLNLIITDLLEINLITYIDNKDLYILHDVKELNDFLQQYSTKFIPLKKEKKKNIIYKNDLKNEKSIDKVINLKNYEKYVECNFDFKRNKCYNIYKNNGKFSHKKFFTTSYEAKISAISYLKELNIIEIIPFKKNEN